MSLSRRAIGIMTGDYNGDGYSDLLFANTGTDDLAVWIVVGTQLVVGAKIGTAPNSPITTKLVADYNGDGTSDLLLFGNYPPDTTRLLWLAETHGSQPATITPLGDNGGSTWRLSGQGDFNGDGKPDFSQINITPNPTTHFTEIAIGEINGAQLTSLQKVGDGVNTPAGWSPAGVDDFNGDGKTDFYFYNFNSHDIAVWKMNGASIQSSSLLGNINADGGWALKDSGDFNGDGKADLLFYNNYTHGVAVWLTDGNQVTAAGQAGVLNSAWHFVDVGDFNGDGKSDLLFQNDTTQGMAVWLMNGTEVITGAPVGTIPAGSMFSGLNQGLQDFNGDNKSDMLFHNYTTGAVTAWLMDGTHVAVNQQIGTIDVTQGWYLV